MRLPQVQNAGGQLRPGPADARLAGKTTGIAVPATTAVSNPAARPKNDRRETLLTVRSASASIGSDIGALQDRLVDRVRATGATRLGFIQETLELDHVVEDALGDDAALVVYDKRIRHRRQDQHLCE